MATIHGLSRMTAAPARQAPVSRSALCGQQLRCPIEGLLPGDATDRCLEMRQGSLRLIAVSACSRKRPLTLRPVIATGSGSAGQTFSRGLMLERGLFYERRRDGLGYARQDREIEQYTGSLEYNKWWRLLRLHTYIRQWNCECNKCYNFKRQFCC